jgi:CheY-like chemotaxis protein
MIMPGLWVDDDEQYLRDNIPRLEEQGLPIDRAHSAAAALGLLKKNPVHYAYLIVDLDMPDIDGVEMIRRVRAIHPTIPIILSSAHVDEPLWEAKLETLGETLPHIPKDFPMGTSPRFKKIVETVTNLCILGVTLAVFQCPLQELASRKEKEREYLVDVAREVNAPYVRRLFATNAEAGWVVISGGPGKIFEFGPKGQEPSSEKLAALAHRHGVPVFAYSRAEELPMGEMSALVQREADISGQPVIDSNNGGTMVFSPEIPALYSQIRELVARSAHDPGLRTEIDHKIEELRALQEAEAEELESRFEGRLQLRSGTGWEHLRRMRERLGDA